MNQRIAHITLLVHDYDEALNFYLQKLHFIIIEDTKLSESKRWVLIAPNGDGGCSLLLAKAANDEQKVAVGNQTGGRVFLFLYTKDFKNDFKNLQDQGVEIVRQPSEEIYGTVAVFKDLYGNLWDLIEKKF